MEGHRRVSLVLVPLLLVASLAACANETPASKVTPADLSSGERSAAWRIADARCERQTPACGVPTSREACVQQKLVRSAADVDLEDCSSAVDEQNLAACVAQIKVGRCGTGITDLPACSHDRICPGVADEGTL